MRRVLRILGRTAMSLSVVLCLATVVVWIRSAGHREIWTLERFEFHPEWRIEPWPGLLGTWCARSVEGVHGRLWVKVRTNTPCARFESATRYQRAPCSADEEKRAFDSSFNPGRRPWRGGSEQAWRFGGVGVRSGRERNVPDIGYPAGSELEVAIPLWTLAIVFGLCPALYAARRLLQATLMRRRLRAGLCTNCGYDLRATPDPAGPRLPRCPECGREVVAAKA